MSDSKGQKLVRIPEKEHYYFDEKSKVIYYLKKSLGEVAKISTKIKYEGPSSVLKASRIIPILLRDKKTKQKKGQTLNLLMGDHLDLFLDRATKSGDKPGTIESKRNSVKHLKEFFEGHLPSEVTDDEWLLFVAFFQAKNPDFNMFNVTKHFRSVCKALHEDGIILKKPKVFNPNKKKEDVKRRKKRNRPYEVDEIQAMDMVCNDDQRLALWLGYDMAFRLDDCIKLDWERVHLSKTEPYIEFHGDENKTGFAGKVPLSDTCAELLRDRRKTATGPWVFHLISDSASPMLSQQIRFEDVVRLSGIGYGSHHILRHTRLTEDFGNKDLPDTLVMKIRRVSLAIAVEHYVHPSKDDNEKFRNTARAKREKR